MPPNQLNASTQRHVSRRSLIAATVSVVGTSAASDVLADTLADVPPREPGAPLSGRSERSKFVDISRLPEAGPGVRHVDPADAFNSKTPLDKLVGVITPTDLHYERSHAGVPDLDPARHRLLMHGMVDSPLVLSVDDLKAMPSITRTVFIECTGNGWENWKRADETLTVQNTHGGCGAGFQSDHWREPGSRPVPELRVGDRRFQGHPGGGMDAGAPYGCRDSPSDRRPVQPIQIRHRATH
jgi:sulfane dehydrogenase subunit SoxC